MAPASPRARGEDALEHQGLAEHTPAELEVPSSRSVAVWRGAGLTEVTDKSFCAKVPGWCMSWGARWLVPATLLVSQPALHTQLSIWCHLLVKTLLNAHPASPMSPQMTITHPTVYLRRDARRHSGLSAAQTFKLPLTQP